MYCLPVLTQRRWEFYSTATSLFFTYRGGIWNALTATNDGTLYFDNLLYQLFVVTHLHLKNEQLPLNMCGVKLSFA